jgi:hypothetical protein
MQFFHASGLPISAPLAADSDDNEDEAYMEVRFALAHHTMHIFDITPNNPKAQDEAKNCRVCRRIAR